MNVTIIHKAEVNDEVLDALAAELPSIISSLLEVRGGKMAILKPEQVSLQFSLASQRDTGAALRIVVLARSIGPRMEAETTLAAAILERIVSLVGRVKQDFSISVRLYLTEIGAAEHQPA